MKISFFEKSPNLNAGSYRIWVNDLCVSLNEAGIASKIITSLDELHEDKSEVVIFSKSSYEIIKSLKIDKSKIVGAINVSADFYDPRIDFVIVGSHEERLSLSLYDNVFLYPLIERKFMNLPKKIHEHNKVFKICFHGHYLHLFKFALNLRNALNKLSTERKIELHIVTGNFPVHKWWKDNIGKPNIDIFFHSYNNISSVITESDLGIVPNVIDLNYMQPDLKNQTSLDLGLYNTDYLLRFKNKTNPGRAYVFYQHGIPVVHDISPSSFEMMALAGIYDVAHDEKTWYRSIKKMIDSIETRQKTSEVFRETFERLYNPVDHAKCLYENIEKIKIQKEK